MQANRQTGKFASKQVSWQSSKLTIKQVGKQASWQASKLASKQVGKLASWLASKLTSKQVDWQASWLASWQASKLTSKQVDKQVSMLASMLTSFVQSLDICQYFFSSTRLMAIGLVFPFSPFASACFRRKFIVGGKRLFFCLRTYSQLPMHPIARPYSSSKTFPNTFARMIVSSFTSVSVV